MTESQEESPPYKLKWEDSGLRSKWKARRAKNKRAAKSRSKNRRKGG